MERTSTVTLSREPSATQHSGAAATPLEALRVFRRLAAPLRLRVGRDSEGWPLVPGRRGTIEWYDAKVLAVHTAHVRLFSRLWALPGIRRWQVGDQEMRALFPLEALPVVAMLIRARTRRRPETAAHLQTRPDAAYSVTSAA